MKVMLSRVDPQSAYKFCHNSALGLRLGRLPPGLDLLLHVNFGRPPWKDVDVTEGLADDHTPAFVRLQIAAGASLDAMRSAATYMRSPRFAKELGQRLAASVSGAGTRDSGAPYRPPAFSWRTARPGH
jgi:hypothetical protein